MGYNCILRIEKVKKGLRVSAIITGASSAWSCILWIFKSNSQHAEMRFHPEQKTASALRASDAKAAGILSLNCHYCPLLFLLTAMIALARLCYTAP